MAKDEFLSVRVSKEFKKLIQGEAKRKGMSLSEYLETTSTDKYQDTKKHMQELIARAKEDRPEFWKEAEKSQVLLDFERMLPDAISDLLNPMGHDPHHHAELVLNFIPLAMRSAAANLDSIHDDWKHMASYKVINASKVLAENMNKVQCEDKDKHIDLIRELKGLIESYAFSFTSLAFAKDSFLKIKEELDKTEKALIKDIQGRANK